MLLTTMQYGNVDEQVAFVHEQLNNVTELRHGFDAIGFSQGTAASRRAPA